MRIYNVRNVDEALGNGVAFLKTFGTQVQGDYGPALIGTEPVSFTYHRPQERVLFQEDCDPNPFYHLFYALWALAGENEIGMLKEYNPAWADYNITAKCSNDEKTLPGAP